MKKFFVIFLLSFFSFGVFAIDCTKIDDYLTSVVKANHIPGMAFILTDADETLFCKTYGQCTNENQQFFIGSESKSFTALCTMQLVEKGLINLDDDISKYLPELKFDKPVTVKSLLNQTSGFGNTMRLSDIKITKSYGKYEYSNLNYDLLGKIIEKASKMSYEEYIQKNVFEPLSMKNSIANTQKVKNNGKLLLGNRNYFGFFVQGDADYPKENSWFHESAGFIATTPSDHGKYLRMFLNGGLSDKNNQIIQKESINKMWFDNVEISKKKSIRYGMGWNCDRLNDGFIISHGGQVENYITYQFILPKKKLAANFMINANDQFGMNALMANTIPDLILIINNEEPSKVNVFLYPLIHILLDIIYLLIFGFSVLIFCKSFKKKDKYNRKDVVFMILKYVLWPFALLSFSTIFARMPLWVVKSYVPDLFFVIVVSSVLSFSGIIVIFCKRFLHLNK